MQIAQNSVVAFHYTLTNDEGEVLDSSDGRQPLTYLHGAGNIIPGLEKQLEGREAGEKLNVAVAPEEGYGEVQPQLVQEVPRDAFQGVEGTGHAVPGPDPGRPTDGHRDQGGRRHRDGRWQPPAARSSTSTSAEVREASQEEIEHGHVHGEGGVEH